MTPLTNQGSGDGKRTQEILGNFQPQEIFGNFKSMYIELKKVNILKNNHLCIKDCHKRERLDGFQKLFVTDYL